MTPPGGKLGIIAGGGELPIVIAKAAQQNGTPIFIVAIEGAADPAAIGAFPHGFAGIGELGKAIRLLKEAGCSEVTLAGRVARPDFSKLKLDTRGLMALPRLIAAAAKGDDALLRVLLEIFEREGLRVLASGDIAQGLLVPLGPLGRLRPSEDDEADIARAMGVIDALGPFDVGQAAVVCRGLVLAVEAAEGTDAMLKRVAALPEDLRGTPSNLKGVMVKIAKPHQDRRVDLPVIGVQTVELAAAAGLSGIAFETGALVLDRPRVVEAADRSGLFLHSFGRDDAQRG